MSRILIGAACFALCLGGAAYSNVIPALSFDEQVKRADIVVIGIAEGLERHPNFAYEELLKIRATSTLKGPAPTRFLLYRDIIAPEMNVRCCDEGKAYVMLLSKMPGENGVYQSVNSYRAVYPVTP